MSERIASLKEEVQREQHLRKESDKKVIHYRMMARSYWERWHWELLQRKEALQRSRGGTRVSVEPRLLEIDEALLLNPEIELQESEVYVGQGSFGVVKLKLFRGIKVAVKELQPLTMLKDVEHEACNVGKLCHPFLPYLFGICTQKQPYKIVIQLHGTHSSHRVLTLTTAIAGKKITSSHAWLGICMQMMEALSYLHEEVHMLHNDIKANNILLTDCTTESQMREKYIQIVLIDFGNATPIQNDCKYNLSDPVKAEYFHKYPHISPEFNEGLTTKTPSGDIYSAEYVMQSIVDHDMFRGLFPGDKNELQIIINRCKCIKYTRRPTAKEGLDLFQNGYLIMCIARHTHVVHSRRQVKREERGKFMQVRTVSCSAVYTDTSHTHKTYRKSMSFYIVYDIGQETNTAH